MIGHRYPSALKNNHYTDTAVRALWYINFKEINLPIRSLFYSFISMDCMFRYRFCRFLCFFLFPRSLIFGPSCELCVFSFHFFSFFCFRNFFFKNQDAQNVLWIWMLNMKVQNIWIARYLVRHDEGHLRRNNITIISDLYNQVRI